MSAERQAARIFRFGPFEADLANRQLFRNGLSVGLPSQPFEVLALLLEHPGQLVTREQLRARLWPSGTIVEFDHSIDAAITKLREALADEAQQPRFIATVPRHGYRFVAPVSALVPSTAEAAPASPLAGAVSAQHAPYRQRLQAALIAIVIALTVAMAYLVVVKFSAPKSALVPHQGTPTMGGPAIRVIPGVADKSIAVLPFTDMSERKDQEYFADGLAEELIDLLAKTPGLHVIARTSSFSFKGKSDDIPAIASKLRVANILEGSVRKSGTRLDRKSGV